MISLKSVLILSASFSILVLLSGCSCKEYCLKNPVIKTVYVEQQVPVLPESPVFVPYSFKSIILNGEEVYTITKGDAAILAANWIDFRDYTRKIKNQYEHRTEINSSTAK